MLFQGKNAIITGARTGIGLACVRRFSEEGANIWAIIHREDQAFLQEIVDLASKYNTWIKPVYIDLSDREAIKTGIQAIVKEKLSIDILVNAAGVVSPNNLIQMTSLDVMHKVMDMNFFSVVQICQLVSRMMCKQKAGSIVNVGSIAGLDGDLAQMEYAASKAALICATKKMAYEWGQYGIRVNAVAPGLTGTKMLDGMAQSDVEFMVENNPLRRQAIPAEIADCICFLSSDQASYITSQVIRIDGGGYKLHLK